MTNAELAQYLAHQIFELGTIGSDKAQRLQFMGGTYPSRETILGGLCESSLADFLEYTLEQAGQS